MDIIRSCAVLLNFASKARMILTCCTVWYWNTDFNILAGTLPVWWSFFYSCFLKVFKSQDLKSGRFVFLTSLCLITTRLTKSLFGILRTLFIWISVEKLPRHIDFLCNVWISGCRRFLDNIAEMSMHLSKVTRGYWIISLTVMAPVFILVSLFFSVSLFTLFSVSHGPQQDTTCVWNTFYACYSS